MKRVLIAGAVAAAFAVAAPAVVAQSAESFTETPAILAAAPAPDASGTPRAAPERRAFRNPSERLEARLAYMRTALKITDTQQAQWESFANVLRTHARDMDQRVQKFRAARADGTTGAQRPDRRNVTAIERLERTQQRMAERSTRLTEVIAAAKPLYAALSPEQKQVADEMIARRGQADRGGHNRGHRGMHRGA